MKCAVIQDFHVTLYANGTDLREHADVDDCNDSIAGAGCFVEVPTGAYFEIRAFARRRSGYLADALQFQVFLDGAIALSTVCEAVNDQFNVRLPGVHQHSSDGNVVLRRFQFANLETSARLQTHAGDSTDAQ